MRARHREFDRILTVLRAAEATDPLTAREILTLCDEHGASFDSSHEVATILGRRADAGDVDVIRDQPYRYRLLQEG